MLAAFVNMLPKNVAKLNRRCVSVNSSPSARAIIHFADGSKEEADIVIGSDGIKSSVRKAVHSGPTAPSFMNQLAYRGLVPIANLEGFQPGELALPRMYCGMDKVNRHVKYICTANSTPPAYCLLPCSR
jgi:salicylate hydroxylase